MRGKAIFAVMLATAVATALYFYRAGFRAVYSVSNSEGSAGAPLNSMAPDNGPRLREEDIRVGEQISHAMENNADITLIPEPLIDDVVVDSTNGFERVITAENLGMFFYTAPDEALATILDAADKEIYDIEWSSAAIGKVNTALTSTRIREHADDWVTDCHTTLCIVKFPHSSLKDYDDNGATTLLENAEFERVVWHRRYKENAAYLIVLLAEFSYDRGQR